MTSVDVSGAADPVAPPPWTVRTAVRLVAAVAVPFGVAAALAPVRDRVASPTVALGLVVVVVTVAALTGRRNAGFGAALGAAAGFDVFHVRPYGSLSISRGEDVQTAVLLLVTAAVVGQLAVWGRRYREVALQSADDLTRIREVSMTVAAGGHAGVVVDAIAEHLREVLTARSCRFDPHPSAAPCARIEDDGEVHYAGASWVSETTGLPGPEIELPVRSGGAVVGRFVLVPTPGALVSPRRRRTAVVLAAAAGSVVAGHGFARR